MPQVDVRPAALDALARPGSPVTWTLTFPAGYLTGKTWSSSVGGIAITPAIAGDVMTISVTGAQTTTLGTGRHVFLLTETTGAAAVRIAGRLLLTDSATDSPDTSVTILTSANVSVAVTVVSATLAGAYLPLTGGTLTGALAVPDEVYGAAWNGSLQVPTKNAVYDKIETLGGGGGSAHTIKEDGVALTARAGLNFGAGLTASDDAVNNETDVVIPTGGVTNDMLAGSIALAKLATDPLARANHTGAQAISTVTSLQTTLDAKVPATEKGAANGVATLGADSKIPSAQIPAIALSEFLGNAATEAAMLALVGQRGDWAVRTDFTPNRVFILKTDDPTLAVNWTDITTPGAVTSVAGRTGAVTLVKGDVGLGSVDNTADTAKPISTAQQTALDAKAPLASPALTGTPTVPDDPYDATGWNGNNGIPTKNAVRDKIETLGGGSSTRITASVEADTTVVNTVTETAVVTLATPTGLAAGDHLILRAAGNLLNNTGATVNYTLRFKLGATTVFATAAITVITTSASRRRWACEIFVALESLAAQRAGGFLTISSAAGTGWLGASNVAAVLVGQGVAAEDLVTSKNVVLTVEMGTASASADFVCTQASIEFIDKAA